MSKPNKKRRTYKYVLVAYWMSFLLGIFSVYVIGSTVFANNNINNSDKVRKWNIGRNCYKNDISITKCLETYKYEKNNNVIVEAWQFFDTVNKSKLFGAYCKYRRLTIDECIKIAEETDHIDERYVEEGYINE